MIDTVLQAAMKREVEQNPHTTPYSKVSAMVRAAAQLFNDGVKLDASSVVETAKSVWESTVVPYDVPYLPEFVERPLEDVAWSACELALKTLVKQFVPSR